ncbi:MAG: 30S ribosomal protein S20 [Candidatus Uhrbacteria bacterium]|nr:30S ribosomal protein S20 [Candidatus Uhrbacteria bacterium]
MAHKAAAIKALRQTKKRTARNVLVKKNIGYLKKKTLKAVGKKEAGSAQETYLKLVQSVDKAAKNKIISRNTAASRKSRLAKKINALKKSA